MKRASVGLGLTAAVLLLSADRAPVDWAFWGGDPAAAITRRSPISIPETSRNSSRRGLEDRRDRAERIRHASRHVEDTPVMIDNVMYVTSPYNKIVALDPEKGTVLWSYDPKSYVDGQPPNGTGYVHRGIAVWRDGNKATRIYLNTRYRLISLDAKTGQPVNTFGDNGVVDLSQGLVWPINKMHYTETSPPVIYKDLVIVGNGVGDRLTYKNDPPAMCARSTSAPANACGVSTPFRRRANSAAIPGATIPISSPVIPTSGRPSRSMRNAAWYICLSALPATTCTAAIAPETTCSGKRLCVWTPIPACASGIFRLFITACGITIWLPLRCSPPSRWTGKKIDAVVQLTKEGFAFVFDRVSGKPVWPIEERPVPASDVPGEHASPTQPFPTKPPAFTQQA